jgi:cytochrome c5
MWIPVLLTALLLCAAVTLALPGQEMEVPTQQEALQEEAKAEEAKAEEVQKEAKAKDVKKLSGKELYRAYCKHCHEPESPHGEYAPLTLIQEQWERFFDEDYVELHKELADSMHEGQNVIELIDKEMLKKIRKFCIEGAADSEQPQTCG